MRLKNYVGIGIVILITAVVGFLILSTDPKPSSSSIHGHGCGHDHGHDEGNHVDPHTAGGSHEKDAHKGHDHGGGSHVAGLTEDGPQEDAHKGHDHGHDHGGASPGAGHTEDGSQEDAHKGHDHDHGSASHVDRHTEAGPQNKDDHKGHDHEGHDHKGHDHDTPADSGHHDHGEVAEGPHGGKLLKDDHFALEVSIVEDGVPPRFRAYWYEEGKPVDPKEVKLSIALKRLGGRVTRFKFVPTGDFLYSDTVVEEPHSFNAKVIAEYRGKEYRWEYSQTEARVGITADAAKTVGIRVETAGPAQIRSVLNLPGEVVLNADRMCHVVPRISGLIAESRKNLGDSVREGEVIAVLDSRELADAKSSYLVHLKREELARINFDRIKNLWERKVSPEKEFLDAQKTFEEERIERLAAAHKLRALSLSKADLEDLRKKPDGPMTRYELRAPVDGVVIAKHMSKGEWVGDKADILSIADLSTVWVDITVYADKLDVVRVGQHVTVKSDSTELEASGTVSYIGPLVGEESRTAMARVVIDNPKGRWRPGMFVSATLVREDDRVPVAVRPEAIQTLDRLGPSVFVRFGDQFEARPVELGRADSQYVEVLEGLAPGEKYASAKSFILKSELGKAGISHTH